MEKRKTSFEDHLSVVEGEHSKTASARTSKGKESLLDQLARELNFGHEKTAEEASGTGVTAQGAPTAEGEKSPADASVAGAAPAVVTATDAVAVPQVVIAGGNPEEVAIGETPKETKPNEGVAISAGDGVVTDANNMHRTPEAVAAAAVGGGGEEGAASVVDEAKTAEARQIGQIIARSFQNELEKIANDRQYSEALEILKEAGLLENYNIKDQGISKTASYEDGCLEKIAENKNLSRQDIINAAIELVEFQKEAANVEEQARQHARDLVKQAQEEAEEEKEEGEEEEKDEEEEKEEEGEKKVASLLQDKSVVNAIKVLKAKNLL